MKTLAKLLVLVALCSCFALGQTTMTNTTLSAAVTATANKVTVASATSITASSSSATFLIYVEKEAMKVLNVSGTILTVSRGAMGTRAVAHASGEPVWAGAAERFIDYDRDGTCTAGSEYPNYHPLINLTNGKKFVCSAGGHWYEIGGRNGTYVDILLCGDMVNNSTTYTSPVTGVASGAFYGAGATGSDLSFALAGSGCSAEDNTTEGTADEVVLANNQLIPVGMYCVVDSSGSNGITINLRSATANLTPDVTVTIPTTETTGSIWRSAAIPVARGATFAGRVITTEDLSSNDFWCITRVQVIE